MDGIGGVMGKVQAKLVRRENELPRINLWGIKRYLPKSETRQDAGR